jgi:hypothetical protein
MRPMKPNVVPPKPAVTALIESATPSRASSQARVRTRGGPVALAVFAALALAACSGSAATPSAAAPSLAPSAAAQSVAPSAAAPNASVTAVSSPCALVTAAEASRLAGATLGAGLEGPGGPGGLSDPTAGATECTYASSQPWNILNVLVVQAPDAATAQANWTQDEAWAQALALNSEPGGGPTWTLKLSDVTVAGADKGAVGTVSAKGAVIAVNASALCVLKGSVFVAITDTVSARPLGTTQAVGPATTAGALEGQMATTLGRLP